MLMERNSNKTTSRSSNYIDRTIVERLKAEIDLSEVASSYVLLTPKGGDEHEGLCPFHNEKTPSFRVNQAKGVYHCFGCGESGDAIALVMQLETLSFPEAVKSLCDRQGIEYTFDDPNELKKSRRDKILYEINETACQVFQESVNKIRPARYLTRRKINPETIALFRLGYAPDSWGYLRDRLNNKYSDKELTTAGVLGNKSENCYDLFRDRLMIPLFDRTGRVIGFSGRAIDDRVKPKYLNTPQTPIFNKKRSIFPWHLSKKSIRQQHCAIVVEGNFDVIKLHQSNITNAIACLGTALDPESINSIVNTVKSNSGRGKLILAFDNDPAGQKAIERVLKEVNLAELDRLKVDLHILQLPGQFKDLDEAIDRNLNSATKAIALAVNWIEYRQQEIDCQPADTAVEFQHKIKEYKKLLQLIPSVEVRDFYLRKITQKLSGADSLRQQQKYLELLKPSNPSKARISSKTTAKAVDKIVFTGLKKLEIETLTVELDLCRTMLFKSTFRSDLRSLVQQRRWFFKNSLCRWIFNHLNLDLIEKSGIYASISLRQQLEQQIGDRALFEDTIEFINLDWIKDRQLLVATLNLIFKPPKSSVSIESLSRKMEQIQISNELESLKLLLKIEADPVKQTKCFHDIIKLKKLLA